jgi:hypothetical protein
MIGEARLAFADGVDDGELDGVGVFPRVTFEVQLPLVCWHTCSLIFPMVRSPPRFTTLSVSFILLMFGEDGRGLGVDVDSPRSRPFVAFWGAGVIIGAIAVIGIDVLVGATTLGVGVPVVDAPAALGVGVPLGELAALRGDVSVKATLMADAVGVARGVSSAFVGGVALGALSTFGVSALRGALSSLDVRALAAGEGDGAA